MLLMQQDIISQLAEKVESQQITLVERISLAKQLAEVGDIRTQTLQPKMIDIAATAFLMGSNEIEIENSLNECIHLFRAFTLDEVREWFYKEFPKHEVKIESFRVSKYLVTNSNFNDFQIDSGYSKTDFILSISNGNHPVKNITIEEAKSYCVWLSKKTNRKFRLLFESEWEWIAKSTNSLLRFPWGNSFGIENANTAELGIGETTAVGIFPNGFSKDGVADLAGNVEEWVDNLYSPYPNGRVIKDRIYNFGNGNYHILRGGCYNLHGDLCLASRRHGYYPNYSITGFRIAETNK